jgi:hypothetical protein
MFFAEPLDARMHLWYSGAAETQTADHGEAIAKTAFVHEE